MKRIQLKNTVITILSAVCLTIFAGCDGDMPEKQTLNENVENNKSNGTSLTELIPEVERLVSKEGGLKMVPDSLDHVTALKSVRIDVNSFEKAFKRLSPSDLSESVVRVEREGRDILWSTAKQDVIIDTFKGIVQINDREETPILPVSDVVLENAALVSKATAFLNDLGISGDEIGEANVMPLMMTTRVNDDPSNPMNGVTETLGKYVFVHREIGGISVGGQRFALYFHNDGTFVRGSGYWTPVNIRNSVVSASPSDENLNRLVAKEIHAKGYSIDKAESIELSTEYFVEPTDETESEFILKLHANASIIAGMQGLAKEAPISTVSVSLAQQL